MKHKSMVRQVQEALQNQLRIGESRHDAKLAEATHSPAGIFSYRTFETYMKQSCAFAQLAKAQYKCRTLEAAVLKFAGNPAGKPVLASVPSHMDVHGCRREYANAMYHTYQEKLRKTEGRGFRNLPPIWELRPVRKPDGSYLKYSDGRRVKEWQLVSSYYRCKNHRKGVVYDKKVMLYVSRQLGHNRISVIAGHYLNK